MRRQKAAPVIPQSHQRGAVLVVSLLVLLVLTLVGISSMDGSIMEEKMAANAQISATTFQEADSAVRQTFYQEKLNEENERAVAVNTAQKGTFAGLHASQNPTPHGIHGISRSSELIYTGDSPAEGSSDDLTHFRHIEILGKANLGNIQSVSRQGYKVLLLK